MGSAASRPPQTAASTRAHFNTDLPKIALLNKVGKHGMIGDGKFMKTYCMRADGHTMVVKVYMRLMDEDLSSMQEQLHKLWVNLSPTKYPFLLPYQMWIRSNSSRGKNQPQPIYLIRQYMAHNLYDRCLSRPFLTDLEKLWIIYQLFTALETCHEQGVVHGDLKPDNVLSSNWHFVVLTDFAPYKPTYIPNDDPTEFQYFFDTSGKRSCYVAPERFVSRDAIIMDGGSNGDNSKPPQKSPDTRASTSDAKKVFDRNAPLEPSMDVFSLGCTVAEVLLDCKTPLLDLPGMLTYLKDSKMERLDDENSPCKALLSRIADQRLRNLVAHMTQRDPTKRLTVSEYRQILQGSLTYYGVLSLPTGTAATKGVQTVETSSKPLFPPYFESALTPLYHRMHLDGVTPDRRASMICRVYAALLRSMTDKVDDRCQLLLCKMLESIPYVKPFVHVQGGRHSSLRITDMASVDTVVNLDDDVSSEEKQAVEEEYMKAARSRKHKGLSSTSTSATGTGTASSQGLDGTDTYTKPLLIDPLQTGEAEGSTDHKRKEPSRNAYDAHTSIKDLLERCTTFVRDIDTFCADGGSSGSSDSADIGAAEAKKCVNSVLQKDIAAFDFFEGPGPGKKEECAGMAIIITLISTTFRHLRFPQSKVCLILLLARLAPLLEDELILQRALPILVTCLDDEHHGHIRALALRAITSMLMHVKTLTSSEADIFPSYLLPALNRVVKDPEIIVRVAYAECLGKLAEVSKRFLEYAHLLALRSSAMNQGSATEKLNGASSKSGKQEAAFPPIPPNGSSSNSSADVPPQPPNQSGGPSTSTILAGTAAGTGSITLAAPLPAVEFPYAKRLRQLHESITNWVKILCDESQGELRKGTGLSCTSSLVKRTLLGSIMRVCVFFGVESCVSQLLPHLLTFFSDQDWELRYAFWTRIASVCAFIGPTLTEAYIMPGLENALVDVEERVMVGALQFLQSLCELELLSIPAIMRYIVSKANVMVLHPCNPVRQATIAFIAAASAYMGSVDTTVFLLPVLRPLFIHEEQESTQCVVLSADALNSLLVSSLPRIQYRTALLQRQKFYLENNSSAADLVMPFNSAIKNGEEAEVDEDVKKKLKLMFSYIDLSARELSSKTMQWRHALAGGINSGTFSASLRRSLSAKQSSSPGSLDALLNITSTHSLSANLQTLMIPHQKFGHGFFYNLSEEQRCLADDVMTMRNPSSICALYGISSSQYDAVRALNQGDPSHFSSLTAHLAPNDIANASSSLNTLVSTDTSLNNNSSISNNSAAPAAAANDVPLNNVSQMHNVSLAYRAILYGKRIKALGIPPLPPDVGALLQPTLGPDKKPKYYNGYTEGLDTSGFNPEQVNPNGRSGWRPKENCLVCNFLEHTQAVNRLAVCPDQSFFGSASSDGTVKIWQLSGLDRAPLPQSSLTYRRHRAPILELCSIENSHSMASADSKGAIHVWRVDIEPQAVASNAAVNSKISSQSSLTVSGMGVMKEIATHEGLVAGLQHFNAECASVVCYVTQSGGLHGWDLRSSMEAFYFPMGPELGSATAMAISPDRTSWVVVGTSRGFIALWDLRYNLMCRLWQHSSASPIWKLACSKSLSGMNSASPFSAAGSPALADTEGAYLFVAAGEKETAVWGLPEAGECLKCFRTVSVSETNERLKPLPVLTEVPLPRHPKAVITGAYETSPAGRNYTNRNDITPGSVRALVGRTPIHLVTAGTDRTIRYWDFKSPAKCYVVSGLEAGQPKATFEAPTNEGINGRLFVCYDSNLPALETTLPSHLPLRGDRGPMVANPGARSSILDLKSVELPIKGMLSCSKDGIIKLWR